MKRKILILKAGELPASVSAVHGSCERQFLRFLEAEGDAVVLDARRENLPDTGWAGVIITGSASSVYDPEPWITKTAEFLRRAAAAQTALYGVCFGHQLLAQTFGGSVARCAWGWELGSANVRLTPAGENDSLFAGVPKKFVAQQSHRDVVVGLPPGAVRLAENDHAPVQSFRLGERVWGTQFHPEFSPPLMRAMIDGLARNSDGGNCAGRPSERPLRERLLAGVRESTEAARCLYNFVRHAVALLLMALFGLAACAGSGSATLIHPFTGSTARCDVLSGDLKKKCIQAAERRGYVRLENLTSEQRGELQSRGFLKLEDLTAEQRGDIAGGLIPQKRAASIP